MAIFEKTTHNKALVDDTEKLTCTITTTQNIDKHTEYILKVHKGPLKDNRWNVSHRYRDFAALHTILQQSNIDLPMPPKKLIGNMQPSFVAERQMALQTYLNEVLKHYILSLNLHVRRFLNPTDYLQNFAEQALQTVSIALRGDGRYELKGPLPDIGWRIRKQYFLVTDTQSRTNCLLSYQSYGPDRYLCDKDIQAAFKSIQNLSHPNIDPVLAIQNLESGAYVVRKIHESGSIRDMLYGTDYTKTYLSKYGNPKIRKPLTMGQIAHYGMQILQALKFLHDKGLPHGNVHTSNVTIDNHKALLMDIGNTLVGVPCLYRLYIIELKRTFTAESIDVYCFGRMLYEMAFATALDSVYCDNVPEGISPELEWVLRLCLSSESCRQQMPSIEELLAQPFFTHAAGLANGHGDSATPHLKFPTILKEELRKGAAVIAHRIRSDQKLVRNARRELRIQEILSSDEELRKHRRKLKKRENMWKSTSSLATTVRSNSMSTASSPTPPHMPLETIVACASTSSPTSAPSSSPSADGRSALLSAICSFDKKRLAKIDSRDR